MRRSRERVPLTHRPRQLRGDAEIGELDEPRIREQDVAALDVPVDLVHAVQVHQALQGFAADVRYLGLVQRELDRFQ